MTTKESEIQSSEQGNNIGRREFLRRAAVGGAGLAVLYVAPQFTSVGAKRAYASITGVTIGSETAFAYGGSLATCFLDLGFGNWGWTNGPLDEGTYNFLLYAGAGGCDISKGTLVGNVDVVYSGGSVQVTYNMTGGHTLNEAQVYAGSTTTPIGPSGGATVAPGLYTVNSGDISGATTYTATISGLSGEIYVVAHGVVA